ncbi:MAG: hypothetical protein Q9175_001383 [Cornicularia normoerica]
MVAGEDAENMGDATVVDDNTDCNIEVGEPLAGIGVVDVAIEKIAGFIEEVADVSIFEEAIECIVEIAEKVMEISADEVATDCIVEVVDGGTGIEKVASTVESALVDKIAFIEDDAGTALVETAAPKDVARTVDKSVAVEDGAGTALEERLSALMMSAAFVRALDSYSYKLKPGLHTFSATPYTTACKCAAGMTGKIPASTTLKFCVPTQIAE